MSSSHASSAMMGCIAVAILAVSGPVLGQAPDSAGMPRASSTDRSAGIIRAYQFQLEDLRRYFEEIQNTPCVNCRQSLLRDMYEVYSEWIYRRGFDLSLKSPDAPVPCEDYVSLGASSCVTLYLAEASVLYGLALGYSGFPLSANLEFQRAELMFAKIMDHEMPVEYGGPMRKAKDWVSEARGKWGTGTGRVEFMQWGLSKAAAEHININDFYFEPATPQSVQDQDYFIQDANWRLMRGLEAIKADNNLLSSYKQQIELPFGEYRIASRRGVAIECKIKVGQDVTDYQIEVHEDKVVCRQLPAKNEGGAR